MTALVSRGRCRPVFNSTFSWPDAPENISCRATTAGGTINLKSVFHVLSVPVWGFSHITRTLEVFLSPCWLKRLRCLGTNATPRYFLAQRNRPFLLAVFAGLVLLSKAGPCSSPGEEGCVWSLSGGRLDCRRHSPPSWDCCAEGGGRAGGESRQEGTRGVSQWGFLGSGDPCFTRWSVWVSQPEPQGIDNWFISEWRHACNLINILWWTFVNTAKQINNKPVAN